MSERRRATAERRWPSMSAITLAHSLRKVCSSDASAHDADACATGVAIASAPNMEGVIGVAWCRAASESRGQRDGMPQREPLAGRVEGRVEV